MLAVFFFAGKDHSLDTVQKTASTLGSLGTLLLSLLASVGGLWWFVQREPLRPKLSIEQETLVLRGNHAGTMLQVFAPEKCWGIDNYCQRVATMGLPSVPHAGTDKRANCETAVVADAEIHWEKCWGREIKLSEVRIRSGETQEMTATLVIKEGTRVIRLYSFTPNKNLNLRSRENRGWTKYAVVDLEEREVQSEHRQRTDESGAVSPT